MYGTSVSYGTDPNVNRMIEETVAILNDVDQRLLALKVGIVQSVPHLAPQILARDPQLAQRLGLSQGIQQPFGNQLGLPFGQMNPQQVPFGIPQFGSPQQSFPGFTPFGAQQQGFPSPFFGAQSPYGQQIPQVPFGAPPFSPQSQGLSPWSGVSPVAGYPGSGFRLW